MSDDPQPGAAARRVIHEVLPDEAGVRADVVLGRQIPGLSRRQARALARAGKLEIDGRRAPPSTRVAAGQTLALELDPGDRPAPLAELEVLATSERFVYVAKPAGVHTVALTPAQPGVLATAVARQFPECREASPDLREGGAVHRLDRPTSGVVAFARSREIWDRARAGFKDDAVGKDYLAVSVLDSERERSPSTLEWPPPLPRDGLQGWLEGPLDRAVLPPAAALQAVIDEPLEPLASLRIRAALGRGARRGLSAVRLDGRRARTVVTPLIRRGPHLLSSLALETGRRHQARVHLAWIGLPIVGDSDYGGDDPDERTRSSASIHLHAFRLDLSAVFPAELAICAPLPPGFWPPA